MRLYTLNKRHFVLVFVTFFVCFAISVLIGLAGEIISTFIRFDETVLGSVNENL